MLTQDEAELYDRQIRLWGVNAQSRLRQSKVLMLGFNGVASEVAKILTLAGIDTLTIVDDQPLQESDLRSNLFCRTPAKIGDSDEAGSKFRTHKVKEKLRILNPLVNVNVDNTPILSKKSDDLKGYDLVTLSTFLKIDEIVEINKMCRSHKIKFYLVLDYGFFGFMFNDLGPEFKFTYEEFDKATNREQLNNDSSLPGTRHSGDQKDPINLNDEDEERVNSTGEDEDEDRHDSNRPKKRRRHLSPERLSKSESKDRDEKKHMAETLSFATFDNVISCKDANFDKKSSPVLFISIALLKFFSEYHHLPRVGAAQCKEDNQEDVASADLSKLNELIASMKDKLNLHESIFKKLDPHWSANISSSLSPICAIVGGAAGQDMIRALSCKDIPICNTFSFDGMEMSGVVEKVGLNGGKRTSVAPVVRDFLEID